MATAAAGSLEPEDCWWSTEVLMPQHSAPFKDFVLISEFSELEGPLPLALVVDETYIDLKPYTSSNPQDEAFQNDLKRLGLESFDFNAFVLRAVSVDRSTEYEQIDQDLTTSSTPLFDEPPPNAFSIPDDTQVYFTDSDLKFFAFTHHLTLFDINARGYVHPVALSFITRDCDKVVIRFEELMDRFNEVSREMKKGNYSNFLLDLKCRLLDLDYTESILINETTSSQQKPALSIQALRQAITATRLMIDTLELNTGHTEDKTKEQKDEQHPYIILKTPKDYKPNYIDTLYPVAHFERKLRSLEQLCHKPLEEEEEEQLHSITQAIPLVVSIIEPQPVNTAAVGTASFVHAITHDMYSEAIKLLKEMTRYLGKSSVELDVDGEELAFIDPLSSAVTMGHTFVLNMENPKPRKKENKETKDPVEKKEKQYYPANLITSQLWKSHHDNTILKTLRRYQSIMVNVIFSLLTGRTVLVKGSRENKDHIQQVVRVLSIFVPGQTQDQHQIIEWFEEKERLTDAEIGSIKLVGLTREIIDSSIHKLDSSCVFDIDSNHGHLESSPVYIEGQWINQLLDRIMLFTSDASYLAYLHTVFMTMSLKAFVYHHLYVCDEFHQHTASGYISEAGSTSSAVTRKWSVRRIMNYLKRIEERENKENGYDELPPSDIISTTSESYLMTDDEDEDFFTAATQRTSEKTDDEDYAEENQATVTLESLQKEQPSKALATIFPDLQMNTATSSKPVARTEGSVSTTYSNNNISGYFDYVPPGDYYTNDDSSEYSSSSNEEVDEVRPDGMTYIEQRGRQYLQDKLKVYGDDQTIVVYLATSVV